MNMISKKDLNYAEMDTLTKSCSPTIVITAIGKVQTHEEETVYVKELDIFFTMKVLQNMSPVLSLWKICMKTDILMNGSTVKNHISLKTGLGYNATQRTSFLLWFQTCQQVLPPVLILQPQWHLQDRRGIILHLPQARLLLQLRQHQATVRLEKERIKVELISLRDDRTTRPVVCCRTWQALPSQPKNSKIKERGNHDRTGRPVVCRLRSRTVEFWNPGVTARIQRKSCGWKSSWTQRLTRQFFSWSIFRVHIQEKWGSGKAQCLYSFP